MNTISQNIMNDTNLSSKFKLDWLHFSTMQKHEPTHNYLKIDNLLYYHDKYNYMLQETAHLDAKRYNWLTEFRNIINKYKKDNEDLIKQMYKLTYQ